MTAPPRRLTLRILRVLTGGALLVFTGCAPALVKLPTGAGEPAVDRVITGLPVWLLREYVAEIGARRGRNGTLRGDGWAAHLERADDFQVGSLRVGQVRLRLYGDEKTLEPVLAALEKKLVRGGG